MPIGVVQPSTDGVPVTTTAAPEGRAAFVCEYARVSSFFSMYHTAALPAASRAAYARLSASPVGLGLGDQPRDRLVAVVEYSGCDDLSMAGHIGVLRIPPSPDVPLSGVQEQLRTEVREVISSAFPASAPHGTVRSFGNLMSWRLHSAIRCY